ncbi:N-acetyltransferase [Sphaerisporangium melleum]|uniref:N-acetyltransferase n=1 Tax=Sphaerisporangium melleum TaxID=321316 RepID=A0A917R8S5_9ACTN|nr:GNAT family N-acetyltransferase [Sphaerisporangium melleum]GGK94553.1 N-acetyltransferase [Sphaerisporangium melleum]GII73255.1 N-acetyltransferase [Sphaerisporangium melleum]
MLKPPYPIETPRLSLRPFTMDDLDELYSFHSRPDVARYLYWDARTRDETRAALETKIGQAELLKDGDALNIAVELRETGALIGDLSLFWRSSEHRQGEIGFVFHPAYHGRGLATEASREILRLGFAGLGLHRIYGRCDARNTASARLMERLGMRREAHFVENEMFKGEWGEELVYAMLQREWSPAA